MQAGKLRHRVTIQRRATTETSLGQPADSWVKVATVWADVSPIRGREWFAAGMEQSTAELRVVMRYRDDVNAQCRIMWGTQPLDIVGAPMNVGGRGTDLELMCSQGVKDGR